MSEVRSTASAISKLPEDVLWDTFYFVAQVSKSSPHDSSELTDLRHASQVCASWRRLLLASSSLWGMAIDLGRLGQRTCHWREEVLRRTGNSLLDIHGFVTISAMDILEQFLASLLNDNWPRIRRLHFSSESSLEPRGYEIMGPAMKSAFQKPAPYLESFSAYFDVYYESSDFSATKFRLFADQAPSLQEFISPHLLRPSPQQLWLSNLRVLDFSCQWTARALLSTLANMPLLESLRVNDPDDDELEIDVHASGGTSLPRITLPRLKSLYVDPVTALEKYLAVLEHLVPAPGFSFCSMRTEPFPLDLADFRAIQQIICSYLHILFRGKCPYYLRIIQTSNLFRLHLSRDFYEFDFKLNFVTWEEDVPVLLETVRSISLEYTTKLSLDIHTGALRLSNTSLNRVVSSMVSVEELRVTADSLRLLLSLPTATENILFPRLESLELEGDCDVTFLVDFLTQRRALKLPIQLLSFYERDLLLHEHCGELRNCLHVLEQFDGMKVTWLPSGESAMREYICGSGNPDLRVDNS